MGEEKRHQMMQNLFGDQSEEEEEIDSEHESNPHPNYVSDEAEGGLGTEGGVEAQGEAEVESEVELRDAEPDPGESEGEREHSSPEWDVGDQMEEVDKGKETYSEGKQKYGSRVATSRRREVVAIVSDKSDNEDEEVDQARSPSSPGEEKDQTQVSHSAVEIRDVFGESDDEEEAEYVVHNDIEQDTQRSPMEEEEEEEEEEGSYEKNRKVEDMLVDEDAQYESEEETVEAKLNDKPVGNPLELEVPLRPPPAVPTKMNIIKVSNIMGVEPKQFDPKTYVEEDTFVPDESGSKKRIRLENNIVRWRSVKHPNGEISEESNARFVRWSDGSLQLLIGNEVLDISVQEAQHDQAHLFLKHDKGIYQSQGRVLRKMRFMPSSLTSKSHRLLTALVDSRHKKVYKVKNCITDIDPEREKEEKEKAASQTIKANTLLNRKREKVNRKYTPMVDRKRQLSPGFLEDALDEDDDQEYYDSRRSRNRFEEDLQQEARAEKRIINAKGHKDIARRPSAAAKSSRGQVDFSESESEREESEYETDGEENERPPLRKRVEEPEEDYEEDEEEEEEDAEVNEASEEEEEHEVRKQKGKGLSSGSVKRKTIESDEDSPPRKSSNQHRRKALVYDSDDE